MPERVKLVVVIPVGPYCAPAFITDTIQSVLHYCGPSRRIILIDDSGCDACKAFGTLSGDIQIIKTPQVLGHGGGLYTSLSLAYQHACEHYDFEVLLRLDTDALVTGPEPEKDAADYFAAHPNVGLIGDYKTYCDGRVRDTSWPVRELKMETSWRRLRRTPGRVFAFRSLLRRAYANGYELGESVLGGAYIFSSACLRKLADAGLMPLQSIRGCWLEEDHIFSLLIKTLNMGLGDFSTGTQPFATARLGLPIAPDEIVRLNKKIIHSTRGWADMDEIAVRSFFRAGRVGAGT